MTKVGENDVWSVSKGSFTIEPIVHNGSQVFTNVHKCSQVFTSVHNGS